ncbi:hypothetical protein [Capnocytophaga sp. oral taxon 878]|uniref:hypothetical protein n=1 Tax=Capnocytophaga sp. oral taxon 878 TaxID=1316596 RepID=UPI000D0414FF|nr:hypothetical protein [Capnocytophaga sp. oral taxon 878]AVM51503.1 hypothetical protein C4H12_10735 [Capnocytophaga sp. oral taxon 878]
MRKGLFLTLLCVPLLGVAQMINTPASRQEKKLVGEVKSYTERVYDVFNGNVQQKRLSTTNGYDFDDSGKVLMNFMQYGGIELRYEYSYNDLGKMLEVKTFRGRNGVELYEKGVYEYDDKGRMMKYSVLVTGVATPVQTYVFSKWDAAGNAVEGELTTSRDKVKVYQEFDKEGRRTLLRMITEGNEAAQMRLSLRYDREGRVVERTMVEGVTTPDVLKYKYDKKGVCVGVNNQRFEHIFDKQGNWVLRKTYIDSKIVGITEREITYFR